MKKFSIKTLGCKLNQYESALISQQLIQSGWEYVRFGEKSDMVLINTCTVTDRSDKKCRNYIRQGAKFSKSGKVYVAGCLVNRDKNAITEMLQVARVFDNVEKENLVSDILSDYHLNSKNLNSKYLVCPQNRSRAFLKIQDGCDGKCSYCIIPSVRGIPSSRDFDDVVENSKILEQNGFNEIVLTGITIGKYDCKGRTLDELVLKILDSTSKVRIRITSIEPLHIDDKIIQLFEKDRVCKHIHLPMQAGSDKVLKEMNRPYSRDEYKNIIKKLRTVCSDIAIGSDVIIGFPGESKKDFDDTLDLIRECDVAYIHHFTFSPRTGTPAADRGDFCKQNEIKERFSQIKELADKQRYAYYNRFIGKTLKAIIEYDSSTCWATTDNYIRAKIINYDEYDLKQGQIAAIQILENNEFLTAKIS